MLYIVETQLIIRSVTNLYDISALSVNHRGTLVEKSCLVLRVFTIRGSFTQDLLSHEWYSFERYLQMHKSLHCSF